MTAEKPSAAFICEICCMQTLSNALPDEVKIEKGVIVHELINGIFAFVSDRCKLSDETALLQFLKCVGESSVV